MEIQANILGVEFLKSAQPSLIFCFFPMFTFGHTLWPVKQSHRINLQTNNIYAQTSFFSKSRKMSGASWILHFCKIERGP